MGQLVWSRPSPSSASASARRSEEERGVDDLAGSEYSDVFHKEDLRGLGLSRRGSAGKTPPPGRGEERAQHMPLSHDIMAIAAASGSKVQGKIDVLREEESSESDRAVWMTADSSSCDGDIDAGSEAERDARPSRKNKRLNKSATEFLTRWLLDHQGEGGKGVGYTLFSCPDMLYHGIIFSTDYPFPSAEEKAEIAARLNLHPQQVSPSVRSRRFYPTLLGASRSNVVCDMHDVM